MPEALTVRELIQETDLGLELVSARGLERTIQGIHLSDLEDPTPFMVPGMVLLTTGQRFASAPEPGLRLLDHLAALDSAALGVGVGHYFDHVDARILGHAEELRIPVFEAPLSVPFRTITSYVYNALASTDMHRLRRSLAVQGHLLDLMLDVSGVEHLVSELASILEADVILFDASGRVVARAGGDSPAGVAWTTVSGPHGDVGPLGVIEDGGTRVYVRRVMVHGILERVLAVTVTDASSAEFADRALSFAQRLLVLERLREGEEVIVRRRMRALLLDDFLAEHGAPEDYVSRLSEQGLNLSSPWRVAVFGIDGFQREVAMRGLTEDRIYQIKSLLIDNLDEFLGERNIPFLTSVQQDSVVALLVLGERDAEPVADLLSDARQILGRALSPHSISVGCSACTVGLEGGARHFGEALEALKMAQDGFGVGSHVVLFDVAGGRFRLVEGQSMEALSALHHRLTAPLEDYDREHRTALVATLRTYIENCLSPSRTARALIIHRSTLYKRLRRIESLLGVDLGCMDDVVELYLALRAAELLRARAGAADAG